MEDQIESIRVGLCDAVSDNRRATTIRDVPCWDCDGMGHPFGGTQYHGEGAVRCYDFDVSCRTCDGEGVIAKCAECNATVGDCDHWEE